MNGNKSGHVLQHLAAYAMPYYPINVWTRVIQLLQTLIIMIAFVLSFLAFFASDYVQRIHTDLTARQRLVSYAAAQNAAGFAMLVTSVLAGLAMLAWVHRAYSNLPALGVSRTRFSSVVAVLLLLIPVVNIVTVWLVMDEIWRGSDPSRFPGNKPFVRDNPSRAVATWCVVNILMLAVGAYLLFTALQVTKPDDLLFVYQVQVVVGILSAAQSALTIGLLGTIRDYQHRRRELAESRDEADALSWAAPR